MERKTMTADEIRENFFLSKQALTNYLKLGVLTPVPGTEDRGKALYYADEVAVIREALTTCQSAITHLNSIRANIQKELDKANPTLAVLQLDAATKDGIANGIIDSIALFMDKALPEVKDARLPLAILQNPDKESVELAIKYLHTGKAHRTPQEFCDDLYNEVSTMDVAFVSHCMDENKALKEENTNLKKQIEELRHTIELLTKAPESKTHLESNGFGNELSEKQVEGLKKSIFECGLSTRSLNCLCCVLDRKQERIWANIVSFTLSEAKKFRNFGKNSLQEVIDKLAEYDLTLGMDIIEIDGKYHSRQKD